MEFTDMSTENLVKPKGKGCVLTPVKGLLLFIAAAAACTIVGVAVYFAHPDKKSGDDRDEMTGSSTTMMPMTSAMPDDDSPLLPTKLSPFHYILNLRPDIYREDPDYFVFSGSVTIEFSAMEETNEITLHQRNLNIYETKTLVKMADTALDINYIKKNIDKEFYTIVMKEKLSANQNYTVYMEFEGPLKNDLYGIYWSSYKDDNDETKYLIASQLQSTDARKTFPCFDEPAIKAKFSVSVDYKPPHTTIGNMDVENTTTLEDGWMRDTYGTTPKMSSYLLAFIVSEFQCRSNLTSNDKNVSVCARPNAIDQVDYALSVAGDMQEFFEEYHEIEYPLPKTVHIAVPDFSAGAMENWGLIIYRETALLYDDDISSAAYRQRVAAVVSHELAHQWFGNLVTCAWWDDIWLNEGFASYMENLGVDSQYTNSSDKYWEMEAQFVTDALHDVLGKDSLLTSHPVYQPVNHPDEISQVFDGITYDKGSSVIRMMNYFLTETVFKQGLTNYLNKNAYGVTTHQDLFAFLTEEAKAAGMDVDVTAVMNTWILQMGYPVVKMEVDGDRLKLTQKRFLFEDPKEGDEIKESPYNYKWTIPITYITQNTADTNPDDLDIHWFKDDEDDIPIVANEGEWILGNVGQRFYYRVNYDNKNWEDLYAQLITDHQVFSIISRAQIIDDSFSLGRAREIDQSMALQAIEYMSAEEHYIPWRALSISINYMARMLQYEDSSIDPLKIFMQGTVKNISDSVGWIESGSDVDLDHLERMSPNLARVVYCYGIKQGDQGDWDYTLTKYESSNVASERTELLQSLGCASDDDILEGYLALLLISETDGGKIKDQDAGTVMAAVSRNSKGKDIAWTFFKDNWDNYIFPTFGTSTFRLASIILSLTESFSTQAELDDLENFIDSIENKGTGAIAFTQAVETANSNIAWRAENEDDIVKWLDDKNGETPP